MPGLLLLILFWWTAPVLADSFICAGSQGIPATEAILPPDIAAKPAQATPSHTTGTRRALVLFARFKGDPTNPVPSWAADLFNPTLPGSFSHFYDTMSFGKLQVRGEVAPRVYESVQPAAAYLADDQTPGDGFGEFSLEILRQADQDIDLAEFDNDGPDGIPNSGDDDGVVDAVFLVLERVPPGFLVAEATGVARLGFAEVFFSSDTGKKGEAIQIFPGQGTIQQGRSFAEAVGVICHEYGHVLGLPDLYNTEFLAKEGAGPEEDSAGVGAWCLMGWGASGWNGNGGPNSFCAWSRMKLGWTEVVEVNRSEEQIVLDGVGKGGVIAKIPLTSREFFLVEYRRREDSYYDRGIPGEGVLIWHVDQAPILGNRRSLFWVDLECADGKWLGGGYPLGKQPDPHQGEDNLDFWAHDAAYTVRHQGNLGDATDSFGGVRFRDFTPETNPDSYSNDRRRSVRIENIRLEGDWASAQVQTEPLLIEVDRLRPRPLVVGQEEEVQFRLNNRGGVPATDLRAVLGTQDSLVEILQPEVRFRDLGVDRQSSAGPLGGAYPKLRFKDLFSGRHQAEMYLDIYANGELVNRVFFSMVGLSPRQRIRQIAVVDTLGNGDGVAQPGEFFSFEMQLDPAQPTASPSPLVYFALRALDDRVPVSGDPGMLFDWKSGASVRAPEFLLSGDVAPGTALAFEFEAKSWFGAWKDTLVIQAGEGKDHTPPRLSEPLVSVQGSILQVSLPERLILEGSGLRWVKAQVYRGTDTAAVAEIPLAWTQDRYQGSSPIRPGAYQISVAVEDEAGNHSRSGLQPVYVLTPPERPPLPEPLAAILGKGFGTCVAYAPNGQLLAVGTGAGIWLYETTTLQEVGLLAGGAQNALAFSPDGRLLASAGYSDTAVRVWDVEQRREISRLKGRRSPVIALKFSPDGQLLVSADQDNARVWQLGQGAEAGSFKESGQLEESSIIAIDLAPDSRTLAMRGIGVQVWDLIQNQRRAFWQREGLGTSTVAFSPDGRLLAMISGFSRELVPLWDLASRQEVGILECPGGLSKLAFSPDRKLLVAGGNLGIFLWNLQTRQLVASWGEEEALFGLDLSPDGRQLAVVVGRVDNQVKVWDLAQQRVQAVLEGYGQPVLKVAFSPDGLTLAVGSVDEAVHLWDVQTQRERAVLRGSTRVFQNPYPGVHALAFSPDGHLLASGGGDDTVRVWDAATQKQLEVIRVDREVRGLAFSPDGSLLAIVDYIGNPVRLWDVVQHRQVGALKSAARVNALAFSPDGRFLATGGYQRIALWDVARQQEARALSQRTGEIERIAFSPDGKLLAAGEIAGTGVRLLDVERLQEVGTLKGTGSRVFSAVFSPDSQVLAIGGEEGSVSLVEVKEQRTVRTLTGHGSGVNSLAFSPDGQLLASGSLDGTVRLWRSAEPTAVEEEQTLPATFSLAPNYPNPFNPTTTLRFSLPQAGEAKLSIYNLLGQRVATLVHGVQEAGPHALQWNGHDDQGRELASGVYLCRLQAGPFHQTRRLVLVK